MTDTPSPLASSRSGRRLVSRITSPFSSKARSITDFTVDLDEPHKQYSQGDSVHGSVHLRVHKPIRVTHVVVRLHGFVQVYKNPGSPGDGFRTATGHTGIGRGKKSGQYYGNGFASLFEDEVVLCGEGRLADGAYRFRFELEFPDTELPSSIDFERGTISYMVSATMTRPSTIAPTTTSDRKLYFLERIDISPFYPPKPRQIRLDPISKRSRARHQARKLMDATERRSRKAESVQGNGQHRASRASSAPSTVTDGNTSTSPAPSEVSFDYVLAGQNLSTSPVNSRQSPPASETRSSTTATSPDAPKPITASVESLTGGCLRGDIIGVKVKVNHIKPIRSLYGVIVTLFRQARVDLHPNIPIGPTEKGVPSQYEDYYPKSLTGLGGLSLSGAGSSHTFRKDLAQVMMPLYVDPTTLTAEVNARLRIPEEAFPTIGSVPGAMMSFKYYIEVILDIQGKLAGQDRNLGYVGGRSSTGLPTNGFDVIETPALAPFGPAIVDTAPVRRGQGVVTSIFELVVGTKDSERRKGKQRAEPASEPEPEPAVLQPLHEPNRLDHGQTSNQADSQYWYDEAGNHHGPWCHAPHSQMDEDWQHYHYHETGHEYSGYDQPPLVIPLPHMPDESQLTEKERVQRAEARLLPSQPPGTEGAMDGDVSREPTAPYLPDEAIATDDARPGASAEAARTNLLLVAPPAQVVEEEVEPAASSAVPAYESPSTSSSRQVNDDKQELQRQRLEMEASAPPDDGDSVLSASHVATAPSAPTLEEADARPVDAYDSHADADGISGLPRYER